MKREPFIDLVDCQKCENCSKICPEVFRLNRLKDYMEVLEMEEYPEDQVNEAIKNCPEKCISWRKTIKN